MANRKKISELDIAQSISRDDLFVVVDPNTDTGNDASSTQKTNKVTLNTIKKFNVSCWKHQFNFGIKIATTFSLTQEMSELVLIVLTEVS